jgi:ABC-type dipeptide/oligopeptide/nickel transport system permease subunit
MALASVWHLLMSADSNLPPTDQASTKQPAPIWTRALVGAVLSLIPSTILAIIIIVIALLLPLVLGGAGGWAGALRPALRLIACVYVVFMVYSAVRYVKRTR